MKKFKGVIYKYYMYIIPTIVLIVYLVNLLRGYMGKCDPILLQNSTGFLELCKAISGFSSVVLAIYGFIVPIVIGKQGDAFVKKFWELVDRDSFIKDMRRVLFSGILTTLISIGLLVVDIMSSILIDVFVSMLIWLLSFFACSSYRFVGILIELAVGKKIKSDSDMEIEDPITEEMSKEIKNNFEKF